MTIVPFLNKINAYIINPILGVVFVLALIYFFVSIVKLIYAGADEKAKAKDAVVWSIVGIFVMISVYGIINLVLRTFNIDKPTYIQTKL